MKIVIAADIFPPDIGGPATYAPRLATEIVERNDIGQISAEVEVVCRSVKSKYEGDVEFPFKVNRVSGSSGKLWSYYDYFLKLFSITKNADVIFAQGPVTAGFPAALVALILKKKFVVKVVGDYAWEQAQNNAATTLMIDDFQKRVPPGKYLFVAAVQRWVCKKANAVIAPSEYLKKIIKGWGIEEEKISVIYNSFDNLNISEKHVEKKPYSLISIGRLVPWKGFETLISLMPELVQHNSSFSLAIYGDGPLKIKLRELIEKLNMQEHVTISMLPKKELFKEIATSELFVLNTGYEGLSHTVLEAMALGTPVITTNVCGNPELIKNNINGILVEYNDSNAFKEQIISLTKNEDKRKEIISFAKQSLERFSYEKMMNQTIDLLISGKKL